MGFRDLMVGRSHECDFPPDVSSLPQATVPRLSVNASSGEIDRQVRQLAAEARTLDALGVYEIRLDVLRGLRPTHIVTQTQCDVCAVSERDVRAAVAQLADCEPEIVSLQPVALEDVWTDILRVAVALGSEESGRKLVASLRRRMDAIAGEAGRLPAPPSVALIEWVDPLLSGGNWMPELVGLAGGRCLFGEVGRHSPRLRFEDLVASDPDVILISPCGFGINRTLRDVPILEERPEWAALRAVRSGRVAVADGNQYFNRPGPRLAETLEILAEILHPGHFDFGHRGAGWMPLGTAA